jgi:hypothetical protein
MARAEREAAPPTPWHRTRLIWAWVGLAAIALFFLIAEHRAHLLGVLPFLLLAACPLLHLLGHGGHGAVNPHRHPGAEQDRR